MWLQLSSSLVSLHINTNDSRCAKIRNRRTFNPARRTEFTKSNTTFSYLDRSRDRPTIKAIHTYVVAINLRQYGVEL